MKSFLKYLLFVLVLVVAIAVLYIQKTRTGDNRGVNWRPEKFTPAIEAKLNLSDLEILSRLDSEYKKLSQAVVPSVVSIYTARRVQQPRIIDPFELFLGQRFRSRQQQVQTALGTGFIISKEGHVVTNNHVIDAMDAIRVQLADGRAAPATVIGADPQTDLALLKIDLPNLEPLSIGDSEAVEVGQIVFAIGNPYGLQESVSQGIISAKGRTAVSDSQVEFLQTDAAVNRGNSGGPLVNIRGEVIGVNSTIFSESGGNQGIAFAIPSNTVKSVVESMIQKGRVIRGYLGISMSTSPGTDGIAVESVVEGSPADRAGIVPGDLIVKVAGKQIKNPGELRNRVASIAVDSDVEIVIKRAGQEKTLKAHIVEQPADYFTAQQQRDPGRSIPPAAPSGALAGISVEDITPQTIQDYDLPQGITGVVVTDIDPDSAAARKLQPGDVIQEINRNAVQNMDEYNQFLSTLNPNANQVLFIVRAGTKAFVVIPPK
ncbi:MAG TPA: trypsin-like peptidase domain-containing protein [Chthoniobacterales bacterium]